MSVLKTAVKIKKMRSGDVILELTPDFSNFSMKRVVKFFLSLLLKIFLPIFSLFDRLAEKRKLVISSVGLGIGLGLSIIVTQRPDTLQAFPVLVYKNNLGSSVEVLKISKLDLYATVRQASLTSFTENIVSDDLIHLEGSGFLGQNKPVVIADLSSRNLLSEIENLNIGDEIMAVGQNNGTYKYRVIEIREIEAQYLPQVIASKENSLVIYKAKNLLRTQLFIVVSIPVE
jgi:hypothetical protein